MSIRVVGQRVWKESDLCLISAVFGYLALKEGQENRSNVTINTYLAFSEGQRQKCVHWVTSDATATPEEMFSI